MLFGLADYDILLASRGSHFRHKREMPPNRFLVDPSRRKRRQEDGEIQVPKATRPHRANDPPPRVVAEDARIPRDVAGFARRNEPGLREVLQTRYSPEPMGRSRPVRRLAGNYEGCTPVALSTGYLNHSSAAVLMINNLPNSRIGVVMSEDNALAAAQAVGTSCQADLNHYMKSDGKFEMEWIERDVKAGLARVLAAVEAQQMMYAELEGKVDGMKRDVRASDEWRRKVQDENDALKERVENDKKVVREALQRAEVAEKEVARLKAREEELMKMREEELASREKVQEELSARIKELEDARGGKEPKGEELEKIRVTHWNDWVNTWVQTDEGNDWVLDASKGARAESYWEALQNVKTQFPKVDIGFWLTKMTGCEGITVDENSRAQFVDKLADPLDSFDAELEDIIAGGEACRAVIRNSKELAKFTEELPALLEHLHGNEVIAPTPPGTQGEAGGVMEEHQEGEEDEEGRVEIPGDDEIQKSLSKAF